MIRRLGAVPSPKACRSKEPPSRAAAPSPAPPPSKVRRETRILLSSHANAEVRPERDGTNQVRQVTAGRLHGATHAIALTLIGATHFAPRREGQDLLRDTRAHRGTGGELATELAQARNLAVYVGTGDLTGGV